MSAFSATVIYWIIQIGVWVYAFYTLTRLRERSQTPVTKRDSPAKRVIMFLVAPAFSFGYFLAPSFLSHKPVEQDQVWLSVLCSVVLTISLVFRFRRQDRAGADDRNA